VDTERVRCIGCGKEGRMEDFSSEYGIEWTCRECYERYGGNLDNIKIRCGVASATISLTELCPRCREIVLRRLEEAKSEVERELKAGLAIMELEQALMEDPRRWKEDNDRWEDRSPIPR